MSKIPYRKNRKRFKVKSIVSYIAFGLVTLWLLTSIYLGVSPIEIIKKGFVSIGSVGGGDTVESLKADIVDRDSIITELKLQLSEQTTTGLKRALVKVSTNTLNMRSKASLSSEILLQIPAESEVGILFYDTETYILQGNPGKWCKIKYAGLEGWVWGNFLLEIE